MWTGFLNQNLGAHSHELKENFRRKVYQVTRKLLETTFNEINLRQET